MWICVALWPTGRNKTTSRCELDFVYSEQIEGGRQQIEGGRKNGLRVATDQTERRRQTVLETLHSKLQFTLHITRFCHCRVTNSNTGIFYCSKATLDCQCGRNLATTRP